MSADQHVDPDPAPLAPYSTVRRAGQTVYVSGMSPRMADGSCAGVSVDADGSRHYDIDVQTTVVFEKLARALESEGLSLSECVTLTCYLVDMADYEAFNTTYARFFKDILPARTCIQVAGLPHSDMRVEVTATAWQSGGSQ